MEGYPPGAIWPADSFEAAQIREVYSRYGLAMYMVQMLEHGMVNAAVVMRTLPALRSHTNEAGWQAAFDHAYESGLAGPTETCSISLAPLPSSPVLCWTA